MAAAAALQNVARNPALQCLIRRSLLLRSPAPESQFPALFNRNPANVVAAPGSFYGMMGLPRVDQSPIILEFAGKRKPAVMDDAVVDDVVDDDDFSDMYVSSDDYSDSD